MVRVTVMGGECGESDGDGRECGESDGDGRRVW